MSQEARDHLEAARSRVDEALDELLPTVKDVPGRLHESMRYSVLAPGKRLRPALALAACRAHGGDEETCLRPAADLSRRSPDSFPSLRAPHP